MKQKALPAFGMGGVFPSRCSAPNVEVINDFNGNGWGIDHHATRRRERPMRWLEICSKSVTIYAKFRATPQSQAASQTPQVTRSATMV
jgi:hypothetical protein